MTSSDKLPFHLQEKKQQMRNALRQEYWRKITQPPPSTEVPSIQVFDPAHQRYFSMTATRAQYFKPNMWNGFLFFAIIIAPIAGFSYYIKKDRDQKETMYRTGQIAYKDREYKLV